MYFCLFLLIQILTYLTLALIVLRDSALRAKGDLET